MDESQRVLPGMLLAAWPDLLDPNFMHGVVLMCHHNEQGAFGLVVNRLTELSTADLMPDHADLAAAAFPVHLGGPVDHSTLHFLHTVPDAISGASCLDGTLWIGGDLDELGRYLRAAGDSAAARVRLLLGYSGWGAGQLEAELAGGSWLPAVSAPDHVFGPAGEGTWRRVVSSMREETGDLEHMPPDVHWN
jgi:putative transcriptional regulator